jgi:hypothetical protein
MNKPLAIVPALALLGSLALASPASATPVKFLFHVKYSPNAMAGTTADAMKTDAAKDPMSKTLAKGLDCSSGKYSLDGDDLDASRVDAKSDGMGGCDLKVAVFKADASEFVATFKNANADDFHFLVKLQGVTAGTVAQMTLQK